MSRRKRTSSILETAQQRLAGLKSLKPAPNFGSEPSVTGFEVDIAALSAKLAGYNQLLSTVDQELNELEDLETSLGDQSSRLLAATKAKYGPNSSEYEQVGGTRVVDRKRAGPRQTTKDSASPKGPASTGQPAAT